MRAEIGAIEDGVYRFQDQVEDDGIESKPYDIKVAVHIQGDESGHRLFRYPRRRRWARSTRRSAYRTRPPTTASCRSPTRPSRRTRAASARSAWSRPPGTLLNVDYPGPEVGGNTETHCKIAGAVIGALSPVLPDRTMAAEGATHTNFVFGGTDEETGEGVRLLRHRALGLGRAQLRRRQRCHRFDQRQLPRRAGRGVRDPLPLPHRVLHPGPGFGRRRREIVAGSARNARSKSLDTEITGSQMSDRHRNRPWGLHGGQPGGLAGTWHQAANTTTWHMIDEAFGKASPSKWSNVRIRPAIRSASRPRAAAAGAIRAAGRASRWLQTSPRAISPPPRRGELRPRRRLRSGGVTGL